MENLSKVNVTIPGVRTYDILIGPGASRALPEAVGRISPRAQAFVVTDRNIAPLYLDSVTALLESNGIAVHSEVLPAGEKTKNIKWYAHLINRITEFDDTRDLVVVALGGGVIGDLAGFVAATYKRGVGLVQMPTTLLACVDSSVGGKTAIDLPRGKNLAGSFYQPHSVLIDTDFLASLPAREMRTGYAEVVKTALIFEMPFFEYLEQNFKAVLAAAPGPLSEVIKRCCAHKASVVVADERDTLGRRALLNLGHTFGHAAEAVLGYSRLRHGEAVAVGMLCAADMSADRGMISIQDAARIESHIKAAGLPLKFKDVSIEELMIAMNLDKKFAAGKKRFVLVEEIGKAVLVSGVSEQEITRTLEGRIV